MANSTDPKGLRTVAVIPAAGLGRRIGSRKKTYLQLLDRPVLAHTLFVFEETPVIDSVVVAVAPEDVEYCSREIVVKYGLRKVRRVVPGGVERQDSVANCIRAAGHNWDIIAVHDGARPLVTRKMIEDTVLTAVRTGAAIAAVPVKDTIKEAVGGVVKRTLPREALWAVQTPQAFRLSILLKAFEAAAVEGFTGTDESSLVERTGAAVRIVEGSYENIKITTGDDLATAELILRKRIPKPVRGS